jgi:hypothetical protein
MIRIQTPLRCYLASLGASVSASAATGAGSSRARFRPSPAVVRRCAFSTSGNNASKPPGGGHNIINKSTSTSPVGSFNGSSGSSSSGGGSSGTRAQPPNMKPFPKSAEVSQRSLPTVGDVIVVSVGIFATIATASVVVGNKWDEWELGKYDSQVLGSLRRYEGCICYSHCYIG